MRKKILGFVFAAALLMALALPLFGGVGTAQAGNPGLAVPPANAAAAKALCGDGVAEANTHSPEAVPDNCPE